MKFRFVITLLMAFALVATADAAPQKRSNVKRHVAVVCNGENRLVIEQNGWYFDLCEPAPSSVSLGDYLWSITLEKEGLPSKRQVIKNFSQTFRTESIEGGVRLVYDNIDAMRPWNIVLTLDFASRPEGGFSVKGTIANNEQGWIIVGFSGPIFDGFQTDFTRHPLIMPTGLGQQFTRMPSPEEPIDKVTMKGALAWSENAKYNRYELTAHYPSRFATMQWCAMAGPDGGIYFGSHDGLRNSKRFNIRYEPQTATVGFHFAHEFVCPVGRSYAIPELVVVPYDGSWHKAASIYRSWYDSALRLQTVPEWVRHSTGWLLTILKQQNDEIMWDYASLGEQLSDIALAEGLDVIGLFGWAHGGHDRFYPDYIPDAAMGGREALVESLRKIHRRGLHAIIYANGQLIDQNGTEYWDATGKHITVVKRDGTLDYQKWHKYTDAPARFHGMACLGTEQWYERMLSLALQANDLGADGILYDQLAVTAPKYCYSPDHGHAVPAMVYVDDRYALLDRIAEHMKSVNPDFIVMTEGLNDAVLESVYYFHGYENGAYVPTQAELDARFDRSAATTIFPEMFLYTFPELITTTRNPSPVNNRLILNYACAYGMRHELESRYAADVRYLTEGRTPLVEDYSNVISKPDLTLVTSRNPEAMLRYTREVIELQKRHADLLWGGRFTDTHGFCLNASGRVVAKSFTDAERMAVVVWNTSDSRPESFGIDVPGYRYVGCDSPEGVPVEPTDALPPQSIRVLLYAR